jgi:drug/metabolite transporter (DMT)-like permease
LTDVSIVDEGELGHDGVDRVGQRRFFTPTTAANEGTFTARDWVLFLSVAGIWGSSFLFIAVGLESLQPGLVTLLRVGSGALALALVPRPRRAIERADRARLVVLSVFWVAVPFTLFPIAEQHINSAVAGLLNGGTPIFTALVATVLLRQPPRGAQLLGIAVGFVGVALVSLPSLDDGSSEAVGVILVILATACYGFSVNIAAPLQQRYGSLDLMANVLVLATVWTLPYGLWGIGDSRFELGPVAAVLFLGVFGTGLAFVIMGSLVGRVGATRASMITYVIPVVALALGVIFRDDVVAPLALVGVVFVIGGAFLASRRAAR